MQTSITTLVLTLFCFAIVAQATTDKATCTITRADASSTTFLYADLDCGDDSNKAASPLGLVGWITDVTTPVPGQVDVKITPVATNQQLYLCILKIESLPFLDVFSRAR